MNTNELRLGNKVLFRGEIDTVTEIGIGNGYCRNNGYFNDDKGYVEPVALSPEILDACGFEKAEGDYLKDAVVYENKIRLFQHDNNDYSLYGYNEQKVYVFYLHELQNLFKLLVGTELTINLDKVKV